MIPVTTPEEMAAIDGAAPEPVEVLIGRAGGALARAALEMLGGTYGRRVVVLVGKGNNGNDGREAARRLRRRGVRVTEVDVGDHPRRLPDADLVIDAAFGTGFHGDYDAPEADAPVLACDIPSGVDGRTGTVAGRALSAERTVTFAALKPGLLLSPGAELAGRVGVADIGLDVSSASAWRVEASDVANWLPRRPRDTHKWASACWVIAGSPGMTGAAHLAARSAMRAGAGYVRLSSPGVDDDPLAPVEAVGVTLPEQGWAGVVLDEVERFRALVVGPGLGVDEHTGPEVRRLAAEAPGPVVVDGDGLTALGKEVADLLRGREVPAVLTPHDGEYERLRGGPVGDDRISAARGLAADVGAVVLLKGSTTVVARPDGRVLITDSGDARLATAGTGDVLSGIIAGLCAGGLGPFEAAAAGADLHGRAGRLGWRRGLVAGDLPDLVPAAIEELE